MNNFLLTINWVDIFIICLVVKILLSGIRSTIMGEVFALLGTLVTTFLVLHYFSQFSVFLHRKIFIPSFISEMLSYLLLWLSVYVVFQLIIMGWLLAFKTEGGKPWDRWGGLILASFRSVLVCGLMFMMFLISGNDYVEKMSQQSWSGRYFTKVSPRVYKWTYEQLVNKFFPNEQINERAFALHTDSKKVKEE